MVHNSVCILCAVRQMFSSLAWPSSRDPFFHSSQSGALSRLARNSSNAAINQTCYSAYVAKVACLYDKRLLCHTRCTFSTPPPKWANSRNYDILSSTTSSVASHQRFTHESHIVTHTWYSIINRQIIAEYSLNGTQTPHVQWSLRRPTCAPEKCPPVRVYLCKSESRFTVLWALERALVYMMPSY